MLGVLPDTVKIPANGYGICIFDRIPASCSPIRVEDKLSAFVKTSVFAEASSFAKASEDKTADKPRAQVYRIKPDIFKKIRPIMSKKNLSSVHK